MKLSKILKVIFISIICIILMTAHCFAKTPLELAKEYESEYSKDMQDIIDFIGDKAKDYSDSVAAYESYANGEKRQPVPFEINADTAFPFFVYRTNIASDSSDFNSHVRRLAHGYFIIINGNSYQQFYRDNGKYIDAGLSGKPTYYDKHGNTIDITFTINGVADYLNDKFTDIDEYKVVGYPYKSASIDLIYVKSEGQEYLIPFIQDPEWYGLSFENGKVYTYESLWPEIAPIKADQTDTNGFKLNSSDFDHTENKGAGSTTEVKPKDETPYIIASAAVSVSILLTAILIMIIKRKKQ